MRRAVLDTDLLSYVTKESDPRFMPKARQYRRVFGYLTITVITVAEVIEGLEAKGKTDELRRFLDASDLFEILPLDIDSSILAGKIAGALARTGQKIGELDPFIAAIAITSGMPLVTNNRRHYQRIIDLGFPLELEDWMSEDEASSD